jgi:uncharacterized protein YkwD
MIKKYILIVTIVLIVSILSMGFTSLDLVSSINSARQGYNKGSVRLNESLSEFAEYRFNMLLAQNQVTDHGDFQKACDNYFGKHGYVSEVIAKSTRLYDAQSYVNAWMQSPAHKKEILYSTYTDIGYTIHEVDGYYIIIVILAELKST